MCVYMCCVMSGDDGGSVSFPLKSIVLKLAEDDFTSFFFFSFLLFLHGQTAYPDGRLSPVSNLKQ